jgi:hypothetical protein
MLCLAGNLIHEMNMVKNMPMAVIEYHRALG